MITLFKSKNAELFHGDGVDLYGLYSHAEHLLFFDPPWQNMREFSFMSRSKNVLAMCDGQTLGVVVDIFGPPAWVFAWDCVSCWYVPGRPLKRMKMCAWYGDISGYNQEGALIPKDMGKARIVRNSRGEYLYEPRGGAMLSDVYSRPITALHSVAGAHRHSKPVEWVRSLIANTLPAGAIVIDPFAGGGASLAACIDLGAAVVGAELDRSIAEKCARTLGGRVSTGPVPGTIDMFGDER